MKNQMRRQSTRRLFVVGYALMCAALLASLWLADTGLLAKEAVIAMLVIGALGVVAGATWMAQLTRGYAIDGGCRDGADERQLEVRNAAYRVAYLVLAGTAVALVLYANVATSVKLSGSLWMPSADSEWRVIGGAIVLLASSLPQAAIAWGEPDLPEDSLPETA